MTVLLSIKPQFVERIFDGTKKYEFRRTIFKQKNVQRVVVYASSPIQKIIGEFEIDEILNDSLDNIWEITHQYSGISKQFYYEYFQDKEKAFAIRIGKIKKYKTFKTLKEYNINHAPQSFVYLDSIKF